MAGTVSFKVYMSTEDESSKEVRRFGVEADVVTNFVYLREKMQTIFPTLRGRHFVISWKDSDGDDVVISSDEELQIALSETASSDIRKLYVILRSEYSSSKNPATHIPCDSGPIHVGVDCDGCDKQIRGFRYKCVQCADYDLCNDCEARGMHPEHCMIRLSVPLQWKPHYGKRLATQVNRFVKKAQSHAAKNDETKECPFKSGKHHGKSRHGNEAPSWIDTFATYLDEWANIPGECPTKETTKETKDTVTPGSSSSASADPSTKSRENEKSPVEQIRLLTNVGLAVGENFLTQLLDPLAHIQANNDKSANAASSASASASVTRDSEKEVTCPRASDESSDKFPGKGKKLQETTSEEAKEASSRTEKISFENEGWTLLNRTESPTASLIAPPVSTSAGAIPKNVQPTAPVEATSKSIYPKLTDEPPKKSQEIPIIYHSNPTIQKSVESMIQMGFSNEGGWLTNLLVSKGGDIAAALDALSPVVRL